MAHTSRSRLHGSTVPGGSQVGTSFIEWTQMSTSFAKSATSSSLVKRPLPPISLSALSRIISPVDFIALIVIAPSSHSSGNAARSNRCVSYACASASGDPRVPMRHNGLSSAIETDVRAPRAAVACAAGAEKAEAEASPAASNRLRIVDFLALAWPHSSSISV